MQSVNSIVLSIILLDIKFYINNPTGYLISGWILVTGIYYPVILK
jgi:hypothetical protein